MSGVTAHRKLRDRGIVEARERGTASTLTLRHARALPLAVAATESERFRAVLVTLSSERDDARARLGRASTPAAQRRAAQDLAASHERAAAALDDLSGVESVETAMRATADAYATLAASAEDEWAAGWNQAGENVRVARPRWWRPSRPLAERTPPARGDRRRRTRVPARLS
jgi:hypothetical protein